MDSLQEVLPIIIPIILIDLGFRIYAIIDLIKVDRLVRWDNKIIWVVIIALVNFGWVFYFLFGRDD